MSEREKEPTGDVERGDRDARERNDDPWTSGSTGGAEGSTGTTYGLDEDPAVDPGAATAGGHDVVEVIRNGERVVRAVPGGEGDALAERWERQVKKQTMLRILLGAVVGTAIFGYGVLSARLLLGAVVTGVISVGTWFSLPNVEIGVIARNASTEEAGRYVDEAREATTGSGEREDDVENDRRPAAGQVVTWLIGAGILGYGILTGQFLLAALVVSIVALVERLTWG